MTCLPPHFEIGTKTDVSLQRKKKFLKYLVNSTQMNILQKDYRVLHLSSRTVQIPWSKSYYLWVYPCRKYCQWQSNWMGLTLTFLSSYIIFVMNQHHFTGANDRIIFWHKSHRTLLPQLWSINETFIILTAFWLAIFKQKKYCFYKAQMLLNNRSNGSTYKDKLIKYVPIYCGHILKIY